MEASSTFDFFLKQLELKKDEPLHNTQSVSSMMARNYVRHVWQLEQYSTLTDDAYESACFSAPGSTNIWTLSFQPNFYSLHGMGVTVNLKRSPMSTGTCERVFFRAHLVDVDGNLCHSREALGPVDYARLAICHRVDISVKKKTLSFADTLTIACEVFEVTEYTANPAHLKVRYSSSEKEAHGILQHLLNYCKRDPEDNVTLISKDDVRIEVNKSLLGARSAVFQTMLENPREQRTEVVELRDVDGTVLRQMVDFINTDTVNHMDQSAEPLLMAADRYGLTKLKMLCEEHLMNSISHSTSSHLLSLAEMANAPMLKKSCDVFKNGN